jgi:hypothetical protein
MKLVLPPKEAPPEIETTAPAFSPTTEPLADGLRS